MKTKKTPARAVTEINLLKTVQRTSPGSVSWLHQEPGSSSVQDLLNCLDH